MRFDTNTSLGVAVAKVAEFWRLLRASFRQVPSVGFVAAAVLFLCEASTRRPIAQLVEPLAVERVKVRPSGYAHPIRFRRVGTDRKVLSQMLVRREYAPVSHLDDVRLILDCGANIGLSAYYLLHCYPEARLLAIEPDPANCALCRENLAAFADRAMVLEAAVWPENRVLRIIPESRKDGAWSLEVEPWAGGDVEGLTIPEILRRAGASGPIDLLKVDIEGAETEVFGNAAAWLHRTRNIAVELHNAVAKTTFRRALQGYEFELQETGELTVVRGLKAPAILTAG
jgi:FkbM family methyltransferase